MKSNNFGYLFKEGIRGIFLHGFMSFAAVCVTVACLVIIGTFSALLYNVNVLVEREAANAEILAFIDETYTEAEAKSVGSRINMLDNVAQANYVSREEALANFVGGEEDTYQGVEPSTLRHRIRVTLEDTALMEQTAQEIAQIPGVADINANYELAEGFSAMQYILQILSAAIIALLLVVSLLIISNTVKLAMYDRRDEIAIMKMVGATNGFIRLPFVVEGLILGLLGAALAFFILWGLYDTLVRWIASVEVLNLLMDFAPFSTLLWPMAAVCGFAGLFVGLFGSVASIRKFLDV